MPERLHNALKRSPIADGVKRAIGQHRQGEGGLERWGETLQPVVNPWGMPEWAALRGEQLLAFRHVQTAVVGQFSIIAMGNPANSNMIVVVESVQAGTANAASLCNLEIALDTAVSGTLGAQTFPASARDRRFKGPLGTSRCFFRVGTSVANTFGAQLEQISILTVPANPFQTFQASLPLILRPGDDLLVIQQVVNEQLNANFGWRERAAFPGELA